MALRRSHQKSRHGCLECKRRRVKCDESRPMCGNCSRRQTDCEYDSTGPLRWMTDEPSRSPRPPSDRQHPPASTPPQPLPDWSLLGRFGSSYINNNPNDSAPLPLNLCDLELMMQWCNRTHEILGRNPVTNHIWRTLIPEEALSHPFLMHGLLALSALHIARTRPPSAASDRDFLQIAVAQQNQALALFRDQLGDINATNGKAMFAFASILVLYTFGFPHTTDPGNPKTGVDDLVQVFVLVRGTQQILAQAGDTVFGDPNWEPVQFLGDFDPNPSERNRIAIDALYRANDNCARMDPILHDSSMYEEAIEKLSDLMAGVEAGLGFSLACRWVIGVKSSYVDRVRDHRPLALVIMAHFCVVLHRIKGVWFCEEWGTRVSRAIWWILADQWKPLIQGCMEEIFGEQFLPEFG